MPSGQARYYGGAWAGGIPNGYDKDTDQFDTLFPENGFDFNKMKQHAQRLEFVHGDNDPYCPLEQVKWLAEQTSSNIHVIPDGGHLGKNLHSFLFC